MTYKEAVLISLEDFPSGAGSKEVYENILTKNIMQFPPSAKTPWDTISSALVMLIQKQDARISRFKNDKGVYRYYLSKFSPQAQEEQEDTAPDNLRGKTFHERDLHPLLCAYLSTKKGGEIMAKTIYHEKSTKAEDHQKWMHPDIIGVKFVKYEVNYCNSLFNATSKKDSMKLFSYELKKEINNDYELKKCFFQAVSNSSWANYGYLVAFDINEDLRAELGRLNNSFGIGFIQLKANPFESQVWFEAKYKSLDFSTIDKLCKINKDFGGFVEDVERIINAGEKYFKPAMSQLVNSCDKVTKEEKEIKKYCLDHHIPWEEE